MAQMFHSAAYAIIRNESGEILFSQRKNTKFMEGKYQLPAGHLDGNESMIAAMARELREELGIEAEKKDMRVVHISHRLAGDREYFDIYVEVTAFTGTPRINEPDKCGDLQYFPIDTATSDQFVMYDIDAIRMADRGIRFSEMDTKDYL